MFDTELIVKPYHECDEDQCKATRKWILEFPFIVSSQHLESKLHVPAGFVFDGNSLPRLLWFSSTPSDYLEAAAVRYK